MTNALKEVMANPDYLVLKRIPSSLERIPHDSTVFIGTIIDLETMGLDARNNEIIEMGVLSFSFTKDSVITGIEGSYNELNDPGKPVPEEITKVTGITDADVQGKAIDWNRVAEILDRSHLVICHNSRFDRNFLELQTPDFIRQIIEKKPFGCTIADINWKDRGYESSKLEYLNFKLGYFYEGHRALVDCWATLNLLLQESGAFGELKKRVKVRDILLCAENAAFDKKDLLRNRNYRWSDGHGTLPKCWWIIIDKENLAAEREWLDSHVYLRTGASDALPVNEITAHKRYSFRAEMIET